MENKVYSGSRRIGIDLDDTLVDFNSALREWHNEVYGTSLRRDDFKSYSLNETLGETEEEISQKMNNFYKSAYFENIQPIAGAIAAIEELSQEDELFSITSRPDFLNEKTIRDLDKFFPNKFSDIIHSINHYSKRKNSGKLKVEICRDLRASRLIDDSLEYIMQCLGTEIKGLLFGDYPWNQLNGLPTNIIRVKNWREALEKIE